VLAPIKIPALRRSKLDTIAAVTCSDVESFGQLADPINF
jgi:hypothetical protein